MPQFWIIGTVPEPIGGVAVTIQRLIENAKVPIVGLIDPYFGKKKVPIAVEHHYPSRSGIFSKFAVLLRLYCLRGSPLLVNGSRAQSILGLAAFLMARNAPKALLLHHGDLMLALPKSRLMDLLIRLVLSSYDRIFCLNEKQLNFYKRFSVPQRKLLLVDSYIKPAGVNQVDGFSKKAKDAIHWAKGAEGNVIISSGYAEEIYRHLWLLRACAESSCIADGSRLIFCCYGPETPHLEKLAEAVALNNQAKLYFGLQPAEFDGLLNEADIYVRPTSIDSFGIATYDAYEKDLVIVASDVCERPDGTLLHAVNDFDGFKHQLMHARTIASDKSGRRHRSKKQVGTRLHLEIAITNWLDNTAPHTETEI